MKGHAVFSKIVVGTDGSVNAERALAVVAEMAKENPEASVYVVSADRPLSPAELREIEAELPDEFRHLFNAHSGAEATLASARQILKSATGRVEFFDVNDDPTDAILDAVERLGADLVVVGSRGEGLAKRAVHGSVSTKVLHHAPCSVLVVKQDV